MTSSALSVQEFLSRHVRDKTVLDVGCADHAADRSVAATWLHRHLRASARRVVGLDILEAAVTALREQGHEMVCGDATSIDLGERFEVVVAGELIEHVDNPGALIRNLARHLAPDGLLIVTTPNPFFLFRAFE